MPARNDNQRIQIVVCISLVLVVGFYVVLGWLYSKGIKLTIRNTPVKVCCGDIFQKNGFRVIPCDTHFDTRVDDIVISKNSLHGQLVLQHGRKNEIKNAVTKEAQRLGLVSDENGQYTFPLGTIVKYRNRNENVTYLLLAMTELDAEFKAHTDMAKYEQMLMKMWHELDRVYAKNDIVLPLLGAGITRFTDGPKGRDAMLRCMLCTLNGCGVTFKSSLQIVIYGKAEDIAFYEYKNMF